jgi:uncharacterized protein YecE (DUF72 family)
LRLARLMAMAIRGAASLEDPAGSPRLCGGISWHCEEVFALLEAHGAACCVLSGAHLPGIVRATTDLVHVRMHGPDHHHLYAGSCSDTGLRWWAAWIQEWEAAGNDVFAYFNNDGNSNAVRHARTPRPC